MKEPESMDELLYFTNRSTGEGKIKAWVFKPQCPKCKKGLLGKPVEKGKVKMRSTEYVCQECGYSEEKDVLEPKLELNIIYTCPECKKSGETTAQYKRKSFQGVQAYVFECKSCGNKIGITKKMKKTKKK